MLVCGRCGLIAPVKRGLCKICHGPLPAGAIDVGDPLPTGVMCVGVRTNWICPRCQRPTVFAAFIGGEVLCGGCGHRSPVDESKWALKLRFAHDVADLSGPDPRGRAPIAGVPLTSNPYASTGIETTTRYEGPAEHQGLVDERDEGSEVMTITSNDPFPLEVGPGHPPCASCRAPYALRFDGGGIVEALCGRCGDRAQFRAPAGAIARYSELVGVISPSHRVDGADARISRTPEGAITVHCSGCGASLEIVEGSAGATCSYCHTFARLPADPSSNVEWGSSFVWWWFFRGPSPLRRALAEPVMEQVELARKLGPAPRRLDDVWLDYLSTTGNSDALGYAFAGAVLGAMVGGVVACIEASGARDIRDVPGVLLVLHVFEIALTFSLLVLALAWAFAMRRRSLERFVLENGDISGSLPFVVTHPDAPGVRIGVLPRSRSASNLTVTLVLLVQVAVLVTLVLAEMSR